MPKSANSRVRRVSRACDFCHARGLKCRWRSVSDLAREQSVGCLTCNDYEVECTMDRPIRKRGRKPTNRIASIAATDVSSTEGPHAFEPSSHSQEDSASVSGPHSDFVSTVHVKRLVKIYRDTMYQCYFPFLPEDDLLVRWADGAPDPDSPSYMLLMALCSVSAQIASLQAVFNESLLAGSPIPSSEEYFYEAISKIPVRIASSHDLDYLRAFGLLAVYSLQRGNNNDLHRYLGLYHALVAQHSLHDESRWPENLSLQNVDDRRRLFWCVYRLEIHSACVLGHIVRMPEAQVSVEYPRITASMDYETRAWTAGWDYITDLFRLLEYAIFSLRGCKNRKSALAVFCERPSPITLLDGLARLKATKPRILTEFPPQDEILRSNRCKYMNVQITCTEALVNIMALLYCQEPASEIMTLAEIFLEDITKADLIMFKIAGSQIVHQLLGVGHILYNTSRCEHGKYWPEAKRLIAFLANLVNDLEDIPSAAEAGARLYRLAETTM